MFRLIEMLSQFPIFSAEELRAMTMYTSDQIARNIDALDDAPDRNPTISEFGFVRPPHKSLWIEAYTKANDVEVYRGAYLKQTSAVDLKRHASQYTPNTAQQWIVSSYIAMKTKISGAYHYLTPAAIALLNITDDALLADPPARTHCVPLPNCTPPDGMHPTEMQIAAAFLPTVYKTLEAINLGTRLTRVRRKPEIRRQAKQYHGIDLYNHLMVEVSDHTPARFADVALPADPKEWS